mgnify:CR=1 FL=1
MKKLIAALSLLFVLSLTACGNSDAALRQENEALRQQISALEAERDNLTKENKDLTEENAALDDTAPESGDDEANPIDRFFEGVDVGSSTAEMNAVADSWAGAWESECRNVAKWLKGQLPLQEDQALVEAYIASAEEQSARMDIMAIYPIADLTLPQTDRSASSGSLRGVLWAGAHQQVWKDTFYQLLYVAPDYAGGVDSAVTAALLVKALRPDQVFAIHIDHGLMRKNESDLICANLADLGLTQMQRINAEDAFFHTELTIDGEKYPMLCDTCEPEKKRAIIGQMFFVVTEEAAKALNLDFHTAFLAQGTLRPDLIESGNPDVSGYAHKIKTHHNDVGVIRTLRDAGHVIETNWDWHKDEVRQVARMLGLAEEIASRQPFPGPGLGIRIIGEVTAEKVRIVQDADAIYREEIAKAGLDRSIGQYFAALTNMRSVGVMGDERTYDYAVALRAVNTVDFMTAEAAEIPFEVLQTVMSRIINEVRGVNRVFYDLTSKPPGTIEFE